MRALTDAVWPAVWPAAAMAAYIEVTRPFVPISLVPVLIDMAVASLVYVATFLAFGISATERRFYLSKIFEATGLPSTWRPAIATEHA